MSWIRNTGNIRTGGFPLARDDKGFPFQEGDGGLAGGWRDSWCGDGCCRAGEGSSKVGEGCSRAGEGGSSKVGERCSRAGEGGSSKVGERCSREELNETLLHPGQSLGWGQDSKLCLILKITALSHSFSLPFLFNYLSFAFYGFLLLISLFSFLSFYLFFKSFFLLSAFLKFVGYLLILILSIMFGLSFL
jgi:hypothetical protein